MTLNHLIMAIARQNGTDGDIAYGSQYAYARAKEKAEKLLALVDGDMDKAISIVAIF